MQKLKPKTRKLILEAAKSEFLERGYRGTSMAKIATIAEVGTSSIYSYFKNKNSILDALVSTTPGLIYKYLKNLQEIKVDEVSIQKSLDFENKIIINFLIRKRDEIILLFQKSNGSKYENFKVEFLNYYYDVGLTSRIKIYKKNNKYHFSELLMRELGELFINIITKSLIRNISKNELKKQMDEVTSFMLYGSYGLIDGHWSNNLSEFDLS